MANELASATFTTEQQRQELDKLEAWARNADSSGWQATSATKCPVARFLTEQYCQALSIFTYDSDDGYVAFHSTGRSIPLSPALNAVNQRVCHLPRSWPVDHTRFLEIVRQVRSLLG
jgi:hypothetical protein